MRIRILAAAFLLAGVGAFAATPSNMNVAAVRPAATPQDLILGKLSIFPENDAWNQDISKEPIDPQSAALIAEIGAGKPLHPDWGTKDGIPFQLVDGNTPRVSPKFQYAGESDAGPYPIPANVLIEGVLSDGPDAPGDRHILCVDPDKHRLYEMWSCWDKNGVWQCGSGAIFDLSKPSASQRPKGWTSADAAGLPIFPGLVRYDEVCIKREITHAVRFTVMKSRKGYIPPASHFASSRKDPSLPPMGMRVRLKSDFDIGGFPADVQVILRALKRYGMILADNGSDWFISGAPDPRWDDDAMNTLKKVKGRDLEVIKMGPVMTGG